MKLLLTFFVLDSATLASDRSTSSKIRDCRTEEVWGERKKGSPTRRAEMGHKGEQGKELLNNKPNTGLKLAYCNLC